MKYPNTPIARKLQGRRPGASSPISARRIFYCDHGSFDTHAGQNPGHGNLWTDVTEGLEAFMADLRQHDQVRQCDRAACSRSSAAACATTAPARIMAPPASLRARRQGEGRPLRRLCLARSGKLVQGDLNPNMDFRGIYSTILDKWLKLDPEPIVNGTFEQPAFLN